MRGTAVTYSPAGQATAVRVSGDPDPANNGLFTLYNDHLGSASAIQKNDGSQPPVVTQYTPFGGYRAGSGPNGVTDRGFTGHKHNDDLGLIYMNARFYVPGMGRFASADTIVPDPTNPQSLNRYSYVLNSPLGFTNPTGHFEEEAIYQYLLNSECGGSFNCADQMLDDWMADGAWWGMLLAASAGDILYGMNNDGSGQFKFIGEGMDRLDGIVTHGGLGAQIRLSQLYAGSYSIPHVIDGSGQIANNIPAWSYSANWEALWYHDTGNVAYRAAFEQAAAVIYEVYGSQYIPPSLSSVYKAARNAAAEEAGVSAVAKRFCGGADFMCEVAYAGVSAAFGEVTRYATPEQADMVVYTEHWRFFHPWGGLVSGANFPTHNGPITAMSYWLSPDISRR